MWSTDPGWMPIGTVRKISYCSIQYLRNTNKQCIGKLKPQTAHSSNSGSYTGQYMSSVCCWFNQPQCVKQSFLPLLIIYESIFFIANRNIHGEGVNDRQVSTTNTSKPFFTLKIWLVILPSSCHTYPCKLVTRSCY